MSAPIPPAIDDSAGPGSPPASIPNHQLLRSIGRGSYGEVWLALNAVGTPRAVKIVRRDRFEREADYEREFSGLQHFEPVSRTHEGLSDILTLGLLPGADGFFYVMELGDNAGQAPGVKAGETHALPASSSPSPPGNHSFPIETYSALTLRVLLKARGALPADEVIALGRALTAALEHLHAHGLVHRDVKPSNILFVGGQPKLADPGLVAGVDDARSLVGTTGYIAPEGPGTPQADLYALGKVLYEAAFGKDRQEFPALPANIASRPDHARLLELNSILLKCCASNQRDRCPSAGELANDLRRLARGGSIRRHHAWKRRLRLCRKVVLSVGPVALAAALVVSPSLRKTPRTKDVAWSPRASANEEYRAGMAALHKGTFAAFHEAETNFVRATELDPRFAAAYARLAETRIWIGAPAGHSDSIFGARRAAEMAVTLDPNSATGHGCLGSTIQLLDHDWEKAERELSLALKLNPESEEILYQYADCLVVAGQARRAVALVEKALQLESHSAAFMQDAGWVFYAAGNFDRAITKFEELIHQEPSTLSTGLGAQLAGAYRENGDYAKAIQLDKEVALLNGEDPALVKQRSDLLLERLEHGGKLAFWQQRIDWARREESDPVWLAELYARVGNQEKAMEYLEAALRSSPLRLTLTINTNPGFDPLRTHPRFVTIARTLTGGAR